MRTISSAFKSRLYDDDYRNYIEKVDIDLQDGTSLTLTNENLWGYGISVDDSVSQNNILEVGSAIVGQCKIVIENLTGTFNSYDFEKAKVVPYVGLTINNSVEYIKMKEYYVNNANHDVSCITLTCYDAMTKFDRPIASSSMQYPATLNHMLPSFSKKMNRVPYSNISAHL